MVRHFLIFCVYQQMGYYDYRRTYRSTTVYLYLCKLSPVQHYMSKSGRKSITSCSVPDSPRVCIY